MMALKGKDISDTATSLNVALRVGLGVRGQRRD